MQGLYETCSTSYFCVSVNFKNPASLGFCLVNWSVLAGPRGYTDRLFSILTAPLARRSSAAIVPARNKGPLKNTSAREGTPVALSRRASPSVGILAMEWNPLAAQPRLNHTPFPYSSSLNYFYQNDSLPIGWKLVFSLLGVIIFERSFIVTNDWV